MKKLILFFVLFANILFGQKQPDSRWIMGIQSADTTEPGHHNIVMRFEPNGIEIDSVNLNMNFESTVATATDSSGKLLFYTNGCEIRNGDGTLMLNGSDINPGKLHDWVCDKGYTMPKAAMALQMPGSKNKWVLIHSGGSYDPYRKVIYGPLYYSIISMNTSTQKGIVGAKNVALLGGDLEPFSVVRHGNGRDWWVVVPRHGSNQYYLWVLGPNGFSAPKTRNIGTAAKCRRTGSSAFSLDGTKYARRNSCMTTVLDFDRCTGLLTNPLNFDARENPTFGGGGVAFSKDKRWLYASAQLSLYSVDLESPNPTLDTAYNWQYYLGVSLGYFQTGPDNQIYIGFMHRENSLSVLADPSQYGDSLDYQNAKIKFPVPVVRTIPHFPNYRLFDKQGSLCDTLNINTATTEIEKEENLFTISPNPANTELEISTKQIAYGNEVQIYNAIGTAVLTQNLTSEKTTLDVSQLPPGMYFYAIISDNKRLQSGKLVVQR